MAGWLRGRSKRSLTASDVRLLRPESRSLDGSGNGVDWSEGSVSAHKNVRSRLLVVDDESDVCEVLRQVLERHSYEVTIETTGRGALERLSRHSYDLVLSDVLMPETDGLALCRELAGHLPRPPILLLTAHPDMAMLTEALRLGVRDFLTKPLALDALLEAVARILQESPASSAEAWPAVAPQSEVSPSDIIGECVQMKRIRRLILDLAGSSTSVLIQGETGTGKENIARALHAASGPRGRPFVALNCAAMPAGLLESELFGHARGAFTDAKTPKKGLLVEADGGTLLLDEISDLPLALQPKLLRAIQERCVRPLGTQREVPFNCRLISAANQDLELAVKTKRFREDLYYRLDVVRIAVPPLRLRGTDILLLAEYFLARFARHGKTLTISEAARARLLAYHWPGNVRELENCMERALALVQGDELTVEDLPDKVRLSELLDDALPEPPLAEPPRSLSLFDTERSHVLRMVTESGGNKTRAAARLGIDRRTLQRRLRRYEMDSK